MILLARAKIKVVMEIVCFSHKPVDLLPFFAAVTFSIEILRSRRSSDCWEFAPDHGNKRVPLPVFDHPTVVDAGF